jgi:putative ABC transport system permease protein
MGRADLSQAIRSLSRTPWYSLTVIGVIALAMTLTTSVLAVVDGLLLKPLPYRQPDRLFALFPGHSELVAEKSPPGVGWRVSPLEFDAWRQAVPEVQLTAFSQNFYQSSTLESASHPVVDARFFETLGVTLDGAGFTTADFIDNAPITPIVITHAVWRSHYALDRTVIGRTFVDEGGRTRRIVGVLPAGFVFPSGPWLIESVRPLAMKDVGSRTRTLAVLARLPAGISPQQVAERLTAATRRLAPTWPAVPAGPNVDDHLRIVRGPYDTVRLDPLRDALAASAGDTVTIVLWAALGLMLLACLNVAGLAMARVQDRDRDLVVRRALGARYRDVARVLAGESAVLALSGAALGILGARTLLAATSGLMPRSLQFLKTPTVDGRVLALSAAATAASMLVVTLLPTRVAWNGSLPSSLGVGRTVTRRHRGWPIVSMQVAILTVMAVGAALIVGSLVRAWGEDPGFDVTRVADLTVSTIRAPAGTPEDLVDGIRRLPGVESAGGIDHPLLENAFNGNSFDTPPGALNVERRADLSDVIEEIGVTSGFLETAGLRPTDGRLITGLECAVGASTVVVSEGVARRYWPGTRAVDQTLTRKGRVFRVVGVVRDSRYMSLDMEPQPAIYWPAAATDRPLVYHLLVTFDRTGRAGLHDVVRTFTKRCPSCTLYKSEMLSDALGASIRPRRFNAWLFSSFGVAALVIVGSGILGLVAMTTGRRTREIGIRMALGSSRGRVVRQILFEQAWAVGLGLLAGGFVAGWAVKYVKAYVYKTPLYDAWSWSGAMAVILAITLLGALMPALRASRADPMRALNVE